MKTKDLIDNWRILLLVACVIISLLLVSNMPRINSGKSIGFGNGLDYGLDFVGGTQIQLRLEKPLDSDIMAVEKGILENRLNSLGLKDIPVRPWGDQYILLQIAGASPGETEYIEQILKQQARFEELIDGNLAVLGDEVRVDLSPRGSEISKSVGGYTWRTLVSHSPEGACRFGKVATGKKGRPVDIFIDRPQNTTMLMTEGSYQSLVNITSSEEGDRNYFGDSVMEIIENRSRIPVVVLDEDLNETLSKLNSYKIRGYVNVILFGDESRISDDVRNFLEENGFNTERKPREGVEYDKWVLSPTFFLDLVGLESSPQLNFDPRGECVYNAEITGSTQTLGEAKEEVKRNQVLLTSGNLPAKATVESKSTTPPTLGMRFLKYAFYTGVLAIFTVALVVFIRYRQVFIVLPLLLTGLSEIIMILGLAALINWELDLPAVAGIIAAVGTGVDHQIVITDETLKRRKQKLVSVVERIRRAFFIIFTAAATTIAAMIPLMSIGAGMLKGFAFTTILGVFVGVFISRPAYARIIGQIIKKRELD